jgi:dihydrofolate reductase
MARTQMIKLIAAVDRQLGMADDHGIPWQGRVPSDTAYFREQTRTGIVVMGFRTYEEFAAPLHGRTNFVMTRAGTALRQGFEPVVELEGFLAAHADETVWIIGGGALYEASLDVADQLYLTRLDADFHCTKFFPSFDGKFSLASRSNPVEENDLSFEFEVWARVDTVRTPALPRR